MVQLRSFTVRAAGSGNLYRNGPLFVGLWFLFSGEQNGALTLKLWIALMGLDDDKL